jgi:hypothetical protein
MSETKTTASCIAVISLGLLGAVIMMTAGTQSIWCLIIGIPFSLVVIRALICKGR